jgi:prepilin-type N-terminal cleavage/methylation domain-containing protein
MTDQCQLRPLVCRAKKTEIVFAMRVRSRQSGFTIIEVLLVTLIMGLLASLAAPTIRLNAARAKMSEVLVMFGSCRNVITEIYLYETDFPTAGNWGCESTAGTPVSPFVDSIETSDEGIIKAVVHGTNNLALDWHTVTLAPIDQSGNVMSSTGRVARWRCGNATDGTDVLPKFLPSSCNGI